MPKPLTELRWLTIRVMREDECSTADIAEVLEITQIHVRTLEKRMREHGIKLPARKLGRSANA